jgi:hypothetical protein
MSQVFISYSRKDQAFVQRLVADLAARLPQVQVFYDMLIQPGASWADTLAAQIEQADVVLAIARRGCALSALSGLAAGEKWRLAERSNS